MKKCYSPNYEGREIEVFDTHTFGKQGYCVRCGEIMTANDHITDLEAKLQLAVEANRYALATFRALNSYTFEDSDHGLLITEAVKKLEALHDETGEQR